jgi:hypothetical protein
MAELKLHCAGPYRAQEHFVKYQGFREALHPWLTCGHAVGVLLSGPGTDESIVPNGLSPDYYQHFLIVLISKDFCTLLELTQV